MSKASSRQHHGFHIHQAGWEGPLVGTAYCARQSKVRHAETALGGMVTCTGLGRLGPSKHQMMCMPCAGVLASTMKRHDRPHQCQCAVCLVFWLEPIDLQQGRKQVVGVD